MLDRAVAQATEAISKSGLPLFPRCPPWSASVLEWDGDVSDFVALGERIGVRVVYFAVEHVSEEEVQTQERRLSPGSRAAVPQQLDDLRSRIGQLREVRVAWPLEGRLHMWSAEADWFGVIADQLDRLAEAHDDEQQEAYEREFKANARAVANDERFALCKNDAERRRLVDAMGLMYSALPGSWEAFMAEVKAVYLNEVQPIRERALVNEARRMLATGMSKKRVATEFGMGADRLDRLLTTYPPDGELDGTLRL